MPTWCYCFLGYMAMLTSDPTTRDQLAYARLLIREAQRHGGRGWLDYDRAFRQQIAADPTLRWNTLNPGLQASTILGQRSSQGAFCTRCRGVDHNRSQCALSCLESEPATPIIPLASHAPTNRKALRVCNSWNSGTCIFPGSCAFRHVCSTCYNPNHKAKECVKIPDASSYRYSPRRPPMPGPGLDTRS